VCASRPCLVPGDDVGFSDAMMRDPEPIVDLRGTHWTLRWRRYAGSNPRTDCLSPAASLWQVSANNCEVGAMAIVMVTSVAALLLAGVSPHAPASVGTETG
jgi:hypothetical protein